jgi:DNA primase
LVRSIPEETISRVKNIANIVDVVSEYVVLKKAGRNYLGLCPFHAEKTPSFTVSAEKQMYYCFGCHTGGNVISFLMHNEGLAFADAVRLLAAKYGIEVPVVNLSPGQKEQLSENERILAINEEAMRFFQQMLNDAGAGAQAMSYLVRRGMTRKIIDTHQLGYAPNRWDGLTRHFANKRIPAELLLKSGLVVPGKNGKGHYDRFRDRVVFPILNLSQQVIGFGGRVMGDGMPKYLNSPETPVYNKSRCLYALGRANRPARASGKVYVVEGYFDVLAMHLYGFENTVATLGTALTPEHVQLLKGMVGSSGQVILVFDSDQAGLKAAQRSVAVFEKGFLDARILVLPPGHDPDSFLRENGPDAFVKAADNALGMIPFIIEMAVRAHGLSLEGKIKVVAEVQEALAAVQDTVARALYVKQLAERLDIDETAIMEKIGRLAGSQNARSTLPTIGGQATAMADSSRLETQIIAMMLCYPAMIPEIIARNLIDHFEDTQFKAIAQMIVRRADAEAAGAADLISLVEDPKYRSILAKLAISEYHWDRQGCERLLTQFEARLQRRAKDILQRQIEAAEKNNDLALLSKLLIRKQQQVRVRD